MLIDLFRHEDLDAFLALAGTEGWICDRWEFDFLLRVFPEGCLAARRGSVSVGFVTSIRYGTSGWIGNLIVPEELRGQGIGTALMKKALEVLADAGAETVWLTASQAGKPIYESLGFAALDVVHRWVGEGRGGGSSARDAIPRSEILEMDRAGWGDRRDAIIDAVTERGRLFANRGGFLFSQSYADGVQLGPWGGGGTSVLLLDDALAAVEPGQRVFLDVPIRNTGQTALLLEKGFSIRGSTLLMCRGTAPAYTPERVFALASMGSLG